MQQPKQQKDWRLDVSILFVDRMCYAQLLMWSLALAHIQTLVNYRTFQRAFYNALLEFTLADRATQCLIHPYQIENDEGGCLELQKCEITFATLPLLSEWRTHALFALTTSTTGISSYNGFIKRRQWHCVICDWTLICPVCPEIIRSSWM